MILLYQFRPAARFKSLRQKLNKFFFEKILYGVKIIECFFLGIQTRDLSISIQSQETDLEGLPGLHFLKR